MGNTAAEIASVLRALQALEPLFAAFIPNATPFLPLFQVAAQAAQTVANDTGKDVGTTITDVISHLTPGQSNAPSLS